MKTIKIEDRVIAINTLSKAALHRVKRCNVIDKLIKRAVNENDSESMMYWQSKYDTEYALLLNLINEQ